MILSQRQLEEIAASTTKDFNRFFFGDEADKPDRSALPTPIDQFAKNYLGLRVCSSIAFSTITRSCLTVSGLSLRMTVIPARTFTVLSSRR